jgi:acyl CoA:acetate/3-ketoacid CoA transferase beta subunit/acyl CoA:acetate/3-ketoacid CoA transferase alpha subunit
LSTEKILKANDRNRSEKIIPLSEAIGKCIKPGMKLHFSIGAEANASVREIARQYWGKNPEFTLITSVVTAPDLLYLITGGLVKRVITSNCSYTYPTPHPIPLLQKMQKEGILQIESWSLYSLEQRLMAAAQGLGFLPTKSLIGSSLAKENVNAFKVISDPFDPHETIGAVRSLFPDISIIHGCVADCDGNTILSPPYFSSIWGARASKGGAIVTVEKIIPTEFIRKHSSFVKLPGYLVRFVCPVFLGAHPQGLASDIMGVAEGYGEDYEFILDFVKASQDPSRLRNWIEEWVIKCPSHEHYLNKLGPKKIAFLRKKSHANMRWDMVESSASPGFNSTEMMVVTAAREIKEIVTQRNYQTILCGIGSPSLATSLAYYQLRKENIHVDLMTGPGRIGFEPQPRDPLLSSSSSTMTCKMLTDSVELYGTFVGGANSRCLSVLGSAQIDQYGNINTVKLGDLYFIGVGGASDAVLSCETLVMVKQSRERFVNKVDFIGCPGTKVKTLVTDLGVFQKLGGEGTFVLTKYCIDPCTTQREEERLRTIQERCGWKVKMNDVIREIVPPTPEELAILRSLDPKGLFIGK